MAGKGVTLKMQNCRSVRHQGMWERGGVAPLIPKLGLAGHSRFSTE
jgi:hypothetical protein